MEEQQLSQALQAIETALRGQFTPVPPDHSVELSTIGTHLSSISNQLVTIADGVSKAMKAELHTEAMRLLQDENAHLMASVSARDRQLQQMRSLIKDLGSPCIGCKKEAWKPHGAECPWSSFNESLQEMLRGGVDEGADQEAG
jgi:hypothetical protein